MGGTNSDTLSEQTQNGDKILSNLAPYEQTVSEMFGPIKILKQQQPPYKYIMLYTQNGINDTSTLRKMEEKCSWYKTLKQHSHIVAIDGIRLLKKTQMCIQKLSLQIYTKYYNWTIARAIQRKLERNQRFKEGDYVYLLQAMLLIVNFFQQINHKRAFDHFDINNVFITPEGKICMHPFPIQMELVQSPIKKPIKIQKSSGSLLQSEQFVVQMSPKKPQTSYQISSPIKKKKTFINQRDDLRDVGAIMFSMMLLNDDYQQIQNYSQEKILQLLEQLKIKQYISNQLKQIMVQLLIDYHNITSQALKARVHYLKEQDKIISANLRLQEGPEFISPKQIEKNYNFNRLSQHRQLKTGAITILSKQRSSKTQE